MRKWMGFAWLMWNVSVCATGLGRGSELKIGYATYLGGNQWEEAREIIAYPDGSVLVGAHVCSAGLPTTVSCFQSNYAGDDPALGPGGIIGGDLYLARLSADGGRVLTATYFGGSKQERSVYGMELDHNGNIVVACLTRSADAPTTPGCFQPKFGGEVDMLVAKLSPDLTRLIWCTYVGGAAGESPRGGLALDQDDGVVVVGTSPSPNFPTTPGVVQPKLKGPRDSAIVKLKSDGSGVVFGTFLGGTGEDDAIMGARLDAAGNIYVAGHTKSGDFPVTPGAPQPKFGGQSDCYLAKLSPHGSRLLYATYLGGRGNEFAEHRPWLTPDGCFILVGPTQSADFPTTEGAYQREQKGTGDGFATKLSVDGKRFVFSTRIGGAGTENLLMPTVDEKGHIWVVGNTSSRDFPVTPDALQVKFGGGEQDGLLAVLSPDGSKLLYATYLGGSGDEMIRSITFGPKGEVYLVGNTSSPDFLTTPGALQAKLGGNRDAFIVKLVAGLPR
jgi:hypothetical protein